MKGIDRVIGVVAIFAAIAVFGQSATFGMGFKMERAVLLPEDGAVESRVNSFTSYGPMGFCGGQVTNSDGTTDASIWRNTGTGPEIWTLMRLSDLGGFNAEVTCLGGFPWDWGWLAGGYVETLSGIERPTVWRSTNNGATWTRRILPRLSNGGNARVLGCIDLGDLGTLLAVGYSIDANNIRHAIGWESADDGGTWTLAHDLAPLAPGQDAEAIGLIADTGNHRLAVGNAFDAQGNEQPMMWDLDNPGTITPLPLPQGAIGGKVNSISNIGSSGQDGIAAGFTYDAQGNSMPCVWLSFPGGPLTLTPLPIPNGFDEGAATGASASRLADGSTLIVVSGHVSNLGDRSGVMWQISDNGNIETFMIDDFHAEPFSAVEATDIAIPNWDAEGNYLGACGNATLTQDGGTGLHAFVVVPATPAKLTRATVNRGTPIAGTLADLLEWDDEEFVVRYGFIAPQYMQTSIIAKTLVADRETLDVIIIANSTEPGGTGKLRMRNFAAGTWNTIHTWPTGIAETIEIVPDLLTDNYVSATGVIQMQVRYSVPVIFGTDFDTFIDLVEVRVR